jgi:hypothetical protein
MLFSMTLRAGVEPLIVIGVMIASAILQAFYKRKEDSETWGELERPATPPLPRPQPPRIPTKAHPEPRTIITRAERSAIPVIPKLPPNLPPPLVFEREGPAGELAHLDQSQKAYERAENLQQAVANRFAEIDRQTERHVPTAPVAHHQASKSAAQLLKNFRHPATTRQAFLASFVLNPPKALE